jgi:hypothetical protein
MSVFFGSLGAYGIDARQSRTPGEEFERARIVEEMDFLVMASAIHHSQVPAIAASLNARLANRFVAMHAWRYSASSRGSHVSVLEPSQANDERTVPEGRFGLFYRAWLPEQTDTTGQPPIVQFAASRDPAADYGRLDVDSLDGLRTIAAPFVRTIQIAARAQRDDSASAEMRARAYLDYLNAGFRVAPTADSEGTWRTAVRERRTAIVAPRLVKQDILESIRARRVYATDDGRLSVRFSINQYPMGAVGSVPPGTPLRIELTFSNPDAPDASYWISLRRDTPGGDLNAAHELSGTDFSGDGRVVFAQFRRSQGEEYFLAHIVQRTDARTDHVWTAPIWLVE